MLPSGSGAAAEADHSGSSNGMSTEPPAPRPPCSKRNGVPSPLTECSPVVGDGGRAAPSVGKCSLIPRRAGLVPEKITYTKEREKHIKVDTQTLPAAPDPLGSHFSGEKQLKRARDRTRCKGPGARGARGPGCRCGPATGLSPVSSPACCGPGLAAVTQSDSVPQIFAFWERPCDLGAGCQEPVKANQEGLPHFLSSLWGGWTHRCTGRTGVSVPGHWHGASKTLGLSWTTGVSVMLIRSLTAGPGGFGVGICHQKDGSLAYKVGDFEPARPPWPACDHLAS